MFLFFYCEQVSIAGQPGGVEAARVKIRVSWNSAMFVLKEHSAQTLVSLYFWPLRCRHGFLGDRVWVQHWPIFTRGTKYHSIIACFCQIYGCRGVCPHDPGDPVELVSRRRVLCIRTPALICAKEGETCLLPGCEMTRVRVQSHWTLTREIAGLAAVLPVWASVDLRALFSVLAGVIRAAEKEGSCPARGQCRD